METNEHLHQAILQALNNQLESGDPPETKETQQRLLASGIGEEETERLLSCVLAAELFDVMKSEKPFERERYVERLRRLPDTSWLDG